MSVISFGLTSILLIVGAIVPLTPGYLSDNQKVCKCIAFRLDDVQDKLNSNSQYAIMTVFVSERVNATLGIVGNAIGRDTTSTSKQVVDYIRANKATFEFANHGYNHEDFSELSEAEQTALLIKSNDSIYRLFGKTPTVFIPPNNIFDDDTPTAMNGARMKVLSGVSANDILYQDTENDVTHIPSNVAMSRYNSESKKWVDIPEAEVKKDIDKAIRNDGYAIVVLRPNSIDSNTGKLRNIIDYADTAGLKTTTISFISNYYKIQIPIKNQQPTGQPVQNVTTVYNNTTNVYENNTSVTTSPAILQEQYDQLIKSIQDLSSITLAEMELIQDIQQTPQERPPQNTTVPGNVDSNNGDSTPPIQSGDGLTSEGMALRDMFANAFQSIAPPSIDGRNLIAAGLATAGLVSLVVIILAVRRRNSHKQRVKADSGQSATATRNKDIKAEKKHKGTDRHTSGEKVNWGD